MKPLRPLFVLAGLAAQLGASPFQGAVPGEVLDEQKISATEGGFTAVLQSLDEFGSALAPLGDFDGDGIPDVVIGSASDDSTFAATGSIYLVFLNPDGTVDSHQRISGDEGNFTGTLSFADRFGSSVDRLADFDGNGVVDLVVGAPLDDDGPFLFNTGAVWILFLRPDGQVLQHQKISVGAQGGGFAGPLSTGDLFGSAVSVLGDVDGDGVVDLAVGARGDGTSAAGAGAIWIVRLDADGTVKGAGKITESVGGFTGSLGFGDQLGSAVAAAGDLDGNGVPDVVVGAPGDDDGGNRAGAIWVLFLNADGSVATHTKIAAGVDLPGDPGDELGASAEAMGDLDGDGVVDLAVGAFGDGDGGSRRGAVWILFLNADGTLKSARKISDTAGSFSGGLEDEDFFGSSVTALGDVDGDGALDIGVGALGDDDGAVGAGAAWIVFLDGLGSQAPKLSDYGCGVNPAGSFALASGDPVLGTTAEFRVDNPLGSQAAGATPIVALSLLPDAAFPCGTPVPGLGMVPGQPGELLLHLGPLQLLPFLLIGPPWAGPGMPAAVTTPIPAAPALAGTFVYAQGLLLDPAAAMGVRFGLTTALELRIGI